MKRLLKILLCTILSLVSFIILLFSAAFVLDIHYGRDAHSHERLVKKAGLGGLDYSLIESSIDTIFCYPLGDCVLCRYVIQFQDTTALNKRTAAWSKRDDGLPIRQLSHFDNFFGAQVAEITSTGEVIIEADYPVESLSAACFPLPR